MEWNIFYVKFHLASNPIVLPRFFVVVDELFHSVFAEEVP
jgi:hypothetical protein